ADLRSYVRARFESRYRVIEAADGADAIVRASASIPDLVISDVMMPGTDGHALCTALRANPETDFIPVILLTAQADQEQRIAGLDRGADDYIVKPFDMRELEARVENLIASRRRLRERFSGRAAPLKPVEGTLSPDDKAYLDRLSAAVQAGLTDPDFGVNELAAALYQDRSHLFRKTRALLDETPSDLLRRSRLERAAELLGDRAGTIAEVAYGVGFNSVSHFCHAFRQAYGATPSAYRESGSRARG
ncbi:MAG TPA: response regulator, partial [Gemmatimonadaceae bacterium]|nr:response regulator [Gemmatimonadaceae bacterium]